MIETTIIVIDERKMCVVLPHILARGPLRAPVQPPAIGSFRALNPSRASKTYRRFITHKGAFGAPLHPIDQRAFHSPWTLDHFMETLSARPLSWRPTVRRLDADQVFRDPITTTKSLPVLFGNMGQSCAGWMRAPASGYASGVSASGCTTGGRSCKRHRRTTLSTYSAPLSAAAQRAAKGTSALCG